MSIVRCGLCNHGPMWHVALSLIRPPLVLLPPSNARPFTFLHHPEVITEAVRRRYLRARERDLLALPSPVSLGRVRPKVPCLCSWGIRSQELVWIRSLVLVFADSPLLLAPSVPGLVTNNPRTRISGNPRQAFAFNTCAANPPKSLSHNGASRLPLPLPSRHPDHSVEGPHSVCTRRTRACS